MKASYLEVQQALLGISLISQQPEPEPKEGDKVDVWTHAVMIRKLLRRTHALNEAAEEINLANGVLGRKYAMREKVKGKERIVEDSGNLVLDTDRIEEYQKEQNRLMRSEIEIEMRPLTRADFNGLAVPSGTVLALLGPFFDEEVPET